MNFKGYPLSVIGSREKNEDAWLVLDEHALYAVADGVGGGLHGEVASSMAVDGLRDRAVQVPDFRDTFYQLQEDILRESMEKIGEPLMGTTLTAVSLSREGARVGHVGDSRCYLFGDATLKLLTEDQEAYDERHGCPVLISYLGMPEGEMPKITEEVFPVVPGNRLLLCTDGLYRQISDHRMIEIIKEHLYSPEILLRALCDEALRVPYSDNVTVVYVEIEA